MYIQDRDHVTRFEERMSEMAYINARLCRVQRFVWPQPTEPEHNAELNWKIMLMT